MVYIFDVLIMLTNQFLIRGKAIRRFRILMHFGKMNIF